MRGEQRLPENHSAIFLRGIIFCPVWRQSLRYGWLSQVRLSDLSFRQVKLGWARLGQVILRQIRLRQVGFGYVMLYEVQLGLSTSVFFLAHETTYVIYKEKYTLALLRAKNCFHVLNIIILGDIFFIIKLLKLDNNFFLVA